MADSQENIWRRRYQDEITQSEKEHHIPTSAAMSGHVISNLFLNILTIRQTRWYASGTARIFMEYHVKEWLLFQRDILGEIDGVLVSENEIIPTTSSQIVEYGKLTEDPSMKYAPGEEQLGALVNNFGWQLLFINRAIELAEKEGKIPLYDALNRLAIWVKHQITEIQLFLGKDPMDGLYQETDDDDE
ncbi:MAG: DNA-binding protein [Bifidobacterium aquikefiri]|uniref:DNA-binding protein n=2 Tax=Bifidobacterium TaxID=1678 RepID=A0A261GCT4_9BIFI|nr:hypothetical protein [Bifidobacterium aquikefiri]OZG68776.1 DNA-binding protein [Bifidobacterium aquikefiri]